MNKFAIAFSVAALAGAAHAQTWVEVGDAGPLIPGQITVGIGALTSIQGSLSTVDIEDLYCIRIDNPSAFSATTNGGAAWDTQLFLFNANGIGVSFNDDISNVTPINRQSRLTGQFVPSPGIYFIGISPYDRDAVSAGGEIWTDTPFDGERAPNGPGAAGVFNGWVGAPSAVTPGPYTIFLTGASYHIPAPGSVALFGLAGMAASRRRRA